MMHAKPTETLQLVVWILADLHIEETQSQLCTWSCFHFRKAKWSYSFTYCTLHSDWLESQGPDRNQFGWRLSDTQAKQTFFAQYFYNCLQLGGTVLH